ncbi:Tripartite ATP-independent periplasmic transporters, DctQ component [Roseivivax jejudonensis]|uniref:TRAP transporter small permease protein n=1 Tax=Roseivivax jejudonensis TaxID=1529041 RepID=A0A1X6Y7Q7_9RHOB|nr:TRAP transporter small permease [Roseivivax jejudonensis]SLN12728.1 Tripartite ATP-independent periplasmic transporters, DctQ component [Roseivivax jejudonensis]
MLGSLRTAADGLIGLSAFLGALGALVEVVVIVADVVGRALGAPLFGSQDLITMTLVIVVFGGMAVCDRVGGHISVDVLERRFPDGLNRAINIGSALLGAVIFAFIAGAVAQSAGLSRMLNLSTNLLGLPKAWFQYALCALAVITALGMLLRAAELAISGRDVTRERPPGVT